MISLTMEEVQQPTLLTPLKVLWMGIRYSLDELGTWEGDIRFICRWLGLGCLLIFARLTLLANRYIITEIALVRSDACWDDDDRDAWQSVLKGTEGRNQMVKPHDITPQLRAVSGLAFKQRSVFDKNWRG